MAARYWRSQGRSDREIAEQAGCSIDTIDYRLAALRRLEEAEGVLMPERPRDRDARQAHAFALRRWRAALLEARPYLDSLGEGERERLARWHTPAAAQARLALINAQAERDRTQAATVSDRQQRRQLAADAAGLNSVLPAHQAELDRLAQGEQVKRRAVAESRCKTMTTADVARLSAVELSSLTADLGLDIEPQVGSSGGVIYRDDLELTTQQRRARGAPTE